MRSDHLSKHIRTHQNKRLAGVEVMSKHSALFVILGALAASSFSYLSRLGVGVFFFSTSFMCVAGFMVFTQWTFHFQIEFRFH